MNDDSIMDKAFSIQKRLYCLFCMITVRNPYGESSEFCLQIDYFYRDWPNQDNRVARSDLRGIKCIVFDLPRALAMSFSRNLFLFLPSIIITIILLTIAGDNYSSLVYHTNNLFFFLLCMLGKNTTRARDARRKKKYARLACRKYS